MAKESAMQPYRALNEVFAVEIVLPLHPDTGLAERPSAGGGVPLALHHCLNTCDHQFCAPLRRASYPLFEWLCKTVRKQEAVV